MTHHDQLKRMYYAQADSQPRPVVALSLKDWTGYADTGQAIQVKQGSAPTVTTYMDKPCCRLDPGCFYHVNYNFKGTGSGLPGTLPGNPKAIGHLTAMGWVAYPSHIKQPCVLFGIGGGFDSSNFRPSRSLGAGKPSSHTMPTAIAIISGSNVAYYAAPTDTAWHHFAVVFNCDSPNWNHAMWLYDFYVDGVYKGHAERDVYNNDFIKFYMGNNQTTNADVVFYLRDLRGYTKALTAEQIQKIYKEGL